MSSPIYPFNRQDTLLNRLAPQSNLRDAIFGNNGPIATTPVTNNPRDTFLGTEFKEVPRGPAVGTNARGGQGELPNTFDYALKGQKGKIVDVVRTYPWTLTKTKDRKDIPYIRLSEHRNNQSLLSRQTLFYTKELGSVLSDAAGGLLNTGTKKRDTLATYKELWPDNPTGWNYLFPHFTKTQFELQTSEWKQIDGLDKKISGTLGSGAAAARKFAGQNSAILRGIAGAFEKIQAGADLGFAAGETALQAVYPVVGVQDRPRVFSGHNSRSITIEFPLYNTLNPYDYIRNRDFYYIFASQNLFAKRNFITGLPPVFYRVYIPGQYFSFASCVTDFTVTNLGNLHFFNNEKVAVPDAYQIKITLTELLMPSLNQYSILRPGTEVVQVMGGE